MVYVGRKRYIPIYFGVYNIINWYNRFHHRFFSYALNKPSVLYEAKDRTWTVSCGGQWKNNNAFSGTHTYGNIGGRDGFGVGYTNTGNYGKTVVQYTKAYIYDKSLKKSSSTNNRSDGDGKKGFAFELQDYTYGRNGTTEYVGYKWAGLCSYSTSFASYSGVATAFYIHTSSSAQITGIKFGVSGKVAGLDIDISNVAKSFTAYSTDTRFGV